MMMMMMMMMIIIITTIIIIMINMIPGEFLIRVHLYKFYFFIIIFFPITVRVVIDTHSVIVLIQANWLVRYLGIQWNLY